METTYDFTGEHYCLTCDKVRSGRMVGTLNADFFACDSCGDLVDRTANENGIMENGAWDW